MPFVHVLFLNCCFSYRYVFHVNVAAQASSGNAIVIWLFIGLLLLD